MPSVGMKRSTRGFVPKYGDLGRVLRSGRRLSPESSEVKHGGRKGSQNSYLVDDNSGKIVGVRTTSEQDTEVTKKSIGRRRVTSAQDVEVTNKSNRRRKVNSEQDIEVTDMDMEVESPESVGVMLSVRRDCKRKEFPQLEEDLMCGTSYVRKKLRKTNVTLSSSVDSVDFQGSYGSKFGILGPEKTSVGGPGEALDVIVESSPCSCSRFTCFLVSVLKFMRSSRMVLPGLTDLICCEPIFEVFSRHGVHFMPCQPSLKAPVEEEDFLCKKRSVKKQVSQNGRDKQQFYVEAVSEEPEEQDKKKAEEVKFRANESFKSAVCKRKRAQALMDNADLAAYLASMALNIAETIQITESASASALWL